MKRIINLSSTLLLGIVLISFFNVANAQETTKNTTEQQVAREYTCPMHPEVVTDKPGKCPKCGMTLVQKTNKKQDDTHNMHNMKDMKKIDDATKMKHDSAKMEKCCITVDKSVKKAA